jgi:hypothetical protein
MLKQEIESWHFPEATGQKAGYTDNPDQPVKDFDHAIDACRYCIANIRVIEKKGGHGGGGGSGQVGAGPTPNRGGPGPGTDKPVYAPRDSTFERPPYVPDTGTRPEFPDRGPVPPPREA